MPPWLRVQLRRTPSANIALIATDTPVLIDSGFGSAASAAHTAAFLNGVRPTAVAITHFHNDHAGGAAALGLPVFLHETEAAMIAAGSPDAFDSAFLEMPVTPFPVARTLREGDVIDAGVELHVVHVPCQTPGHVAFWEPRDRVLFSGDLLQAGDVGWVRYDRAGALEETVAALEKLAALNPAIVVPGHGPVVTDVPAAVRQNLERYASWGDDPARPARHAARRIAITTLALQPQTAADLARRAWAQALPDGVFEEVLEGLGGLVREQDGVLHTTISPETAP